MATVIPNIAPYCPKCKSKNTRVHNDDYKMQRELKCYNCNTEFWETDSTGKIRLYAEMWKEKRVGYY